MTVPAEPAGPLGPYVTGAELVAHLGGTVPDDVADSCAYAATAAVWAVVADPGWNAAAEPPVPVPEGVRRVTLMVGAELYKAGSAPGGEYQLDAYQTVTGAITSNLLRKYGAALAPWRNLGGMVG